MPAGPHERDEAARHALTLRRQRAHHVVHVGDDEEPGAEAGEASATAMRVRRRAVVEASRQPEPPRLDGQRDRRQPAPEPPIGEPPAERRRARLARAAPPRRAGRRAPPGSLADRSGSTAPGARSRTGRRWPGGARRWPRRTRGDRRGRPGPRRAAAPRRAIGKAVGGRRAVPAGKTPSHREPEHHEREPREVDDRASRATPTRKPPARGPATAPTLAASPSQPRARPRRPAAVARVTRAGALAMTSAAPSPCTTRAPEQPWPRWAPARRARCATPVSASPPRKTRACPARSASRPAGIRASAKVTT